MFQISQVGGVLESSGPPLEDGHRDFEDWCILGWGIHENKWANSNDAKCICTIPLLTITSLSKILITSTLNTISKPLVK